MIKGIGWIPDTPDFRDLVYQAPPPKALPEKVDLRPKMPPVYDQGDLGSCTANAVGANFQYQQTRRGWADFMPSRLFIYYEARKAIHTENSDSGAVIRDAIKSVNRVGVCSEIELPYDIAKFTISPTRKMYDNARFHRSVSYMRVTQGLSQIKQCLAQGNPICFGFMVYESFDKIGADGIMPMPTEDESALGGHAVLCVGYLLIGGWLYFICRNSWGSNWGKEGYFFMPAKYLLDPDLSADLWTIQWVGGWVPQGEN